MSSPVAQAVGPRWRVAAAGALVVALGTDPVAAFQLRPVDPIEWSVFDSARTFVGGVGLGVLRDQHASLAGTRGDLLELGNFRLVWRSSRIGIEFGGTLRRRFSDQVVVGEPVLGAQAPTGETRQDAGDIRAATVIRVSGDDDPVLVALRFGTRLPTTSEQPGLDRDRTDFFATVGAHWHFARLALGAESGVAINGTRVNGVDQLDVWTYAFGVEYRAGKFAALGTLIGQNDFHRRVVRGNEDLNELRFGVRLGDRHWISATAVRGLADFSPAGGLLLMAGIRR